ncbi:hypothetical protein CDV31_012525 [Fusarium ambrosium]|uniref:Plastocyanin-like domain-containing protein n=1 Tax=Fusarium ambrosium TaxID=131363 RepID=A0A428T9C9_9HYPO|nr:hypothetical protein CDV31_012525 [Fusarium ambrosium]
MGERWEVVVDFSHSGGQNLTLRNQDGVDKEADYANTDQVMRFVVGIDTVASSCTVKKISGPSHGVAFGDAQDRVLANVTRGTIEMWEFENDGGRTHPIHTHPVDFRILSCTEKDRGVLPYESARLKDVVWFAPGEKATVDVHYQPWDGEYMLRCHNIIHEDHGMMALINVTQSRDLGYKETAFSDPMGTHWRAASAPDELYTRDAITNKVQSMASLRPCNADKGFRRLGEYWDARGGPAQGVSRNGPGDSAAGDGHLGDEDEDGYGETDSCQRELEKSGLW